ncbi:hypothetical protein BT63DRAFT_437695 [Microthyrium microscopicum]|uniref:BTB domain-containing protein n=1 Tax=Microthyrium microscopicum TaxID=703497 RepID=A0A6A6UKZ2_9PEZI|nr:hypothetical protein BT63DRAFT_437695 [Microthyrium microscopicum]
MTSTSASKLVPQVLAVGSPPPNFTKNITLNPLFKDIHRHDLRKSFQKGPLVDIHLAKADGDNSKESDGAIIMQFPIAMLKRYAPNFAVTSSQSRLTLPAGSFDRNAIEDILYWFAQIANSPAAPIPSWTIPGGTFLKLFQYYRAFETLSMRQFSRPFEDVLNRYLQHYALTVQELGELLGGLRYSNRLNQNVIASAALVLKDTRTPKAKKLELIEFFETKHPSLLDGAIREVRRVEKEKEST